MAKGRWFRAGDVIPVIACLSAAVVLCLWCADKAQGQLLRVQTPTEEMVFPLDTDREDTVYGRDGLTLTVRIEDGCAYVWQADCPDQVCVHTGRLTHDGETAACLPAGVILTVEGGDDSSPDAVAR